MEYTEAYRRMLEFTGAKTQTQMAEILGVRQSSISDAMRRGALPGGWLLTLLERYGANPDFIRTGIGEPFLIPSPDREGIQSKPLAYPDKSLESDAWGCICSRSIIYLSQEEREDGLFRISCECGLSGKWEETEKEAVFSWNMTQASLAGPYSARELSMRRALRIAQQNGKVEESAGIANLLKKIIQGYQCITDGTRSEQ